MISETLREVGMSKTPREPQTIRGPGSRVSAPQAETKTARRLPPTYALAWLHLMPQSEFPIRSTDDLAAKISRLIMSRPSPVAADSHGLPAGAQPKSRRKT
jgi:hypothetical protein